MSLSFLPSESAGGKSEETFRPSSLPTSTLSSLLPRCVLSPSLPPSNPSLSLPLSPPTLGTTTSPPLSLRRSLSPPPVVESPSWIHLPSYLYFPPNATLLPISKSSKPSLNPWEVKAVNISFQIVTSLSSLPTSTSQKEESGAGSRDQRRRSRRGRLLSLFFLLLLLLLSPLQESRREEKEKRRNYVEGQKRSRSSRWT